MVDVINKKNETLKRERNLGIDLLRIISILLIIISHSIPFYGTNISHIDFNIATRNMQHLLMIFIRYCGQIGNAIFIMCSAYFLLDSKKINVKKILHIISDCTVISVGFLIIFLIIGYEFDTKIILAQIFPTVFTLNYWFIVCYILYYLIHPLLNIIINSLSQRRLLTIDIILIFLYCFINMFIEVEFFYNELIGFIILYFIIAYVKKYLNNYSESKLSNFFVLLISIWLLVLQVILLNVLGLEYEFYSDKMLYWAKIFNPLIILISISLFNLFRFIKLKSKVISYLSSLSLLVYLFSDNYLLRENIKPAYFLSIYGKGNILVWVEIEFIRLVIFGFIAAVIYNKTIQKLTKWISEKCTIIIKRTGNKVLDKIIKIN